MSSHAVHEGFVHEGSPQKTTDEAMIKKQLYLLTQQCPKHGASTPEEVSEEKG